MTVSYHDHNISLLLPMCQWACRLVSLGDEQGVTLAWLGLAAVTTLGERSTIVGPLTIT